jgi:hypothetical protein
MRIVAALGGNALLERGESPDADIQEAHVASAVTALACFCMIIRWSSCMGGARSWVCSPWKVPKTGHCHGRTAASRKNGFRSITPEAVFMPDVHYVVSATEIEGPGSGCREPI